MDRTASILIVDDDAHWRSTLQDFLSVHGFSASSAAELDEAEALLAIEPFDLLLVDRMFGRDPDRGLEIIRILKQRHPDQELILLTSYLDTIATLNVMRNDAHTALSKDDSDQLLEGVREVLLKRVLRLSRFPRWAGNAILGSPVVRSLREDLLAAADPRTCFLELILLLGDLAAVGPIARPFFLRLVADTRLAEQLPRLGDLDERALATLAELLPCVVDSLDPTERRDLLRCASTSGSPCAPPKNP